MVMVFNLLVGTHYGYLNRKPAVDTLLDLFGPWPGYVVAEIGLVAGVWALMTWPWTRVARPEDADGAALGQRPAGSTQRTRTRPCVHRLERMGSGAPVPSCRLRTTRAASNTWPILGASCCQ